VKKKRGKEEPASSPILGPNEFYAQAIEVGNYRAATRACVGALRRVPHDPQWEIRLRGSLRYRNGRPPRGKR